ncbi:MAG: diaminopropionate ammonia-lyase [Paracoccaceae bacterium]|jgi:diaminopropionate ammonia-lyase
MDMRVLDNQYLGLGLQLVELEQVIAPSVAAELPKELAKKCPKYAETPLVRADTIAEEFGVASAWLKDERTRMGLGSFKALGAAYVIANQANQANVTNTEQFDTLLVGHTYATASAGNHGLSVAAGARIFGARAVIFLADPVPEAFAERLRGMGAQVERTGANYEESMAAAQLAAEQNSWTLLSDASWAGYTELPHRLMEGYLLMAAEITDQLTQPPTHIFLQAGVGGMAAALAAYFRKIWGEGPRVIIVEPEAAPALLESIQAGKPVVTTGPVSNMGRLDCKGPSLIALKGLARDANQFMTISDEQGEQVLNVLRKAGIETTPSGGAGVAALVFGAARPELGLNSGSRVLAIISEEALA